jgi:hypothetical protein
MCFLRDNEEYVGLENEIECNFKEFTFKDEYNYLAETISISAKQQLNCSMSRTD